MMQAPRASFRALLVVLASAGLASAACAQERMRPGLWEMTTEMAPARAGMAGLPGMGSPQQRCISDAEAAQANGTAAQVRAALVAESKECTFDDVKVEADRVSYRQTCGDFGQVFDVRYRADTMDGTITMKGAAGASIIKTRGKRIGPCP
ncbi:DUF3617 family protein [Xanthobacter aminoxidans]|uniref:DUF3617 domain-containing protein n=1 Tax=Xanthobacter aminoxidans TaxID=186280 RepID=UPI0037291D24